MVNAGSLKTTTLFLNFKDLSSACSSSEDERQKFSRDNSFRRGTTQQERCVFVNILFMLYLIYDCVRTIKLASFRLVCCYSIFIFHLLLIKITVILTVILHKGEGNNFGRGVDIGKILTL